MKLAFLLFAVGGCMATAMPTTADAAATCAGVLTESQEAGFEKFFSTPPGPNLSWDGTSPISMSYMSKKVSAARLTQLNVPSPVVSDSVTLTDQGAQDLKGWLNQDAASTIPGWFSTAVGVFVPAAWVGIGVDLISQYVNSMGDTGRISAANIAGTVTADGQVAGLEQIATDTDGSLKYIFTYVYSANINGHPTVAPLYWCKADVVTT